MTPAPILPLHVRGLGYEAGGRAMLADVGFTIARGGITALLGANGAGKSLTLRLCQGLLAPTAGEIAWNSDAPTSRLRHAMVFQQPVMLRRSALGNLTHALAAAGMPRAARRQRAGAALARFGLSGLAGQPARLLSGGEQQRVAIARAWALEPELLLLDEPTAHLDAGATREIEAMLRGLADEGITIVLATHDLGQARRLAQRVLLLHRGRLVEDCAASAFFGGEAGPEARSLLAGDLLW